MKEQIPIVSTKLIKTELLTKAKSFGFRIINYEFIKITYNGTIADLKNTLVFTSSHAVTAFAKHRNDETISPRKFNVYCLQGETLNAVKEIRDVQVLGVAENASMLATKIIKDREALELSFICGKRRRDELPEMLEKHGVQIQEIKLYDTKYNLHHVKDDYSGVLFFSPSAVESFFQINKLKAGTPCFCIGPTTASAVQQYTRNPVITAAEPSQESVLDTVIFFFK